MTITKMPFGRLGHESTRTLFGAAALSHVTQAEADRTLGILLDYGVNHIDVAADYGDAELRIAPWLKRYPDQFFIATKTGQRRAPGAQQELHRSLDRMGVDHVDLWQLHNLVDPIEWDIALSPGGAIEAAVEAKRQGLVRGIGVTGHGLQIAATHRRSLERFDFDSVLLPYNYTTLQNEYYAANFDALLATCRERNVAVQTIKSIACQPWMGRPRTRATWYEPLEDQTDIDTAVWWVLENPQVFLNTVGDIDLLPRVLDAASRFDERTPTSRISMEEHLSGLEAVPLFV
jgi:aryl-alcohol dehydrogenase-like predicted oxidoreductase